MITEDQIKGKFKALERYYEQLHSDQKNIDSFYELDFDAGVPEDYPVRMPDTARQWVDAGVRHYTLDNPKSRVYLRNDSKAAHDQVALMETFYNFWMRKDILQIKEAAKKLLLRGEVFIETIMNGKYLTQDNDERLFFFPFSLNVLEPINTYASPAHEGLVPKYIIKRFDITVSEALALCEENNWKWEPKKKNAADDTLVSYTAYKDKEWKAFMLEDTLLDVKPNIYGFVNVVHINAGLGQSSYEGKPEYNVRSIIYPRTDMLKLEVRNLSQMDAILQRYAYPRYKAILASTNTDIIKQVYPNGTIPTDPSEWLVDVENQLKTEMMQGEQPPSGLFTQLAMIKEYAAVPAVLSGARPMGVYSGQHQETLVATAKPIYKDPFKNLEDGLGVNLGMGSRMEEKINRYPVMLKNFSDPDNKAYFKLTPEDINGHYDVEVQLLAEPPEATDARKYLGANLRKGGSISKHKELKDYHDMSEQEIIDELSTQNAEKWIESQGALDFGGRDAMSRLGMDQQLEEVTQAGMAVSKNRPPPKRGEGVSQNLMEKANTTEARVGAELAQ